MSEISDGYGKFDVILDMADPEFAEKFRDAIGAKPGEAIEVFGPQFERTDGVVPASPNDIWERVRTLPISTLKALGCGKWDEPNERGEVLMLFPKEWYAHIPDGFVLTCIDGSVEPFVRGETDDDYRYGCLAYGVMASQPE